MFEHLPWAAGRRREEKAPMAGPQFYTRWDQEAELYGSQGSAIAAG